MRRGRRGVLSVGRCHGAPAGGVGGGEPCCSKGAVRRGAGEEEGLDVPLESDKR